MQLLDGAVVRDEIFKRLKPRISKLKRPPGLAVVLVGHNPASEIYVRGKIKACGELGIYSEKITPPETVTTEELLAIIGDLDRRPEIDGILVQMPLPKQVDSRRVLEAVAPDKDSDGFHPMNVGHLVAGRPAPRACTPAGIMEMLKYYHVPIDGQTGGDHRAQRYRREADGADAAARKRDRDHLPFAHVESGGRVPARGYSGRGDRQGRAGDQRIHCAGRGGDRRGQNRVTDRAEAEILGRSEEFARKGSVLVGDVNPMDVQHAAAAYTPVPGGVGPLTIGMLMSNTVELAERHVAFSESCSA